MSSAPVYELGFASNTVVAPGPVLEITAGTAKPMAILEIGWGPSGNFASVCDIGRASNTPAGGALVTATTPATLGPGAGASVGGIYIGGWTTAPTAPAAANMVNSGAVFAGARTGWVFSWWPGELIVQPGRANALILWLAATDSNPRGWVKWTE